MATMQPLTPSERDRYIVERLRESAHELSGETLAAELGISRVALWKRIETLKAWGYGIAASKRGYILVRDDGLAPWDLDVPGVVELFDEIPSTMDEARRLAAEGAPSGSLALALRQSAGRGRSGGEWASPSGGLYASILLRSDLPPSHAGALVLECAGALIASLARVAALAPRFRWPNEILSGSRKIAGILVELSGSIERADHYIVGLGLDFAHIPVDAASSNGVAEPGRQAPRRALVAAELTKALARWAASPDLAPKRRSGLLPAAPEAATARLWDGSLRGVRISGFTERGDATLDDGSALSMGECLRLAYEHE